MEYQAQYHVMYLVHHYALQSHIGPMPQEDLDVCPGRGQEASQIEGNTTH